MCDVMSNKSVKIKLCGLRRKEDTEIANRVCPDYIGMVFAEKSRRCVSLEDAVRLSSALSEGIIPVGVFVNMPLKEAAKYASAVRVFQLHGDEDEEYIRRLRELIPEQCEIWKAVRVRTPKDIAAADEYSCDKLLLDAFSAKEYGGTGKRFDISLIKEKPKKPFFVAGGVSADNILEIYKDIQRFEPYGFDLSSSVETDGYKDEKKVFALMEIVRGGINNV